MQATSQAKAKAILGRLGDIDLRLLRVFKVVADCGGMAAAELELNIAMSTISRHIKDLEERFGLVPCRRGLVPCRRGRGGFALTAEGDKVYAAAEQLLSATESFRGNLHEIHRGLGGELHVAIFEKSATKPGAPIAEAIAAFHAAAPEVSLQLHAGTIAMIERGVMSGQFQLGIVPEHRRSESLVYGELFDETMRLYAGLGHAWFNTGQALPGWKELREQPLAALAYRSPNMMLAHERRLERQATASDQEGVATLVLSGGFVGFRRLSARALRGRLRAQRAHTRGGTGNAELPLRLLVRAPACTGARRRCQGRRRAFGQPWSWRMCGRGRADEAAVQQIDRVSLIGSQRVVVDV